MSGLMRIAAVLLGVLFAGGVFAQNPAAAVTRAHIRFTLEDPQLQPRAYTLDVHEDGSATYTAIYAASVAGDPAVQQVERPIHIHGLFVSRLFQAARKDHFFASNCADGHRRVAFTGKKTLAYAGPDGSGSCTFNYSREKELNRITSELVAVGYTLQVGKRLKQEHRYDRLSLADELEGLQEALRDGRALDPENIAPELEAIANDGAVLDLARARARSLLERTVASR
jgi:hypothetical protein